MSCILNQRCLDLSETFDINQFSTNVLLLYPRKTSKNHCFSDVFRGYKSITLVENGWMIVFYLLIVLNFWDSGNSCSPWPHVLLKREKKVSFVFSIPLTFKIATSSSDSSREELLRNLCYIYFDNSDRNHSLVVNIKTYWTIAILQFCPITCIFPVWTYIIN